MNSICKTDMTPDCVCNNKPLQEDITKCIKAACTVKESLRTFMSLLFDIKPS